MSVQHLASVGRRRQGAFFKVYICLFRLPGSTGDETLQALLGRPALYT